MSQRHVRLATIRRRIPFGARYFLAGLEGIESSFAVGVAILVGLLFVEADRYSLITTLIVSLLVQGYNNAALKYSSEHYMDELNGRTSSHPLRVYAIPAAIEFIPHVLISAVIVWPLLVIRDPLLAVLICGLVTLIVLFLAGFYRGRILGRRGLYDAVETTTLGIGIILMGGVSGYILHVVF